MVHLKHRLHLVGQRTCGWNPRGHSGSPFEDGFTWCIALTHWRDFKRLALTRFYRANELNSIARAKTLTCRLLPSHAISTAVSSSVAKAVFSWAFVLAGFYLNFLYQFFVMFIAHDISVMQNSRTKPAVDGGRTLYKLIPHYFRFRPFRYTKKILYIHRHTYTYTYKHTRIQDRGGDARDLRWDFAPPTAAARYK